MSSFTLGTSGSAPPLFPLTSIPDAVSLVFEWAALIPLVLYLASANHSRQLIGRIALSDAFSVGFFPKLGVLDSVARLMHEAPDFLDRVSSIGEFRREVWDVNWGSCFPCANGSVSEMVFAHSIRRAGKPVPVGIIPRSTNGASQSVGQESSSGPEKGVREQGGKPSFIRPQTLHVICCTRGDPQTRIGVYSTIGKWIVRTVTIIILLGIALISCFNGMYGTMTSAIISIAFQIIGFCIAVVHPSSYLGDNERGTLGSACMLVANHQNASTWYLFTGDRGVVDGVLNKNMLFSIESRFGSGSNNEGKSFGTRFLVLSLQTLALLQLLVLTYVAAQKGWDGIGLLVFITIAYLSDKIIHNSSWLVETWKKKHGIQLEAKTFDFKGRVAMLGAIQVFKENPVSCWMDSILVPSTRRDVWLEKLNNETKDNHSASEDDFGSEEKAQLGDDGVRWVRDNLSRARAASRLMKTCFTEV